MSTIQQFIFIACVGLVAARLLGWLTLYLSARRWIRRFFQGRGAHVTRIRAYDGFFRRGSIREAISTAPYRVWVASLGGGESEFTCFVRYIPFIGLALGVEVWPNETVAA